MNNKKENASPKETREQRLSAKQRENSSSSQT